MKITTIGGGSTYSPELVNGFLKWAAQLDLRELWLMDIDAERLATVGGFVKRMVAAAGNPFTVHLTTDLEAAVRDAAFVTTQIRVGGAAARREDEYLGRRWNLVGQETTGIGGMAKALRTVPVILNIARTMQRLCPNAWLVNFTNPSGLVTEALQRYVPAVRSVGLCNSPIGYQMHVAEAHGLENPFAVHLDYLGLNHLSWIRGARIGERDVWPEMFAAALEDAREDSSPPVPATVMEQLGVICNYYLRYYYRTTSVLAQQAQGGPSRGEEVIQIERDLLQQYADPALTHMPADLLKRGGAYYSTAAVQLIAALVLGLDEEHIVNTRVQNAVPGVPADWVMELPCRVARNTLIPLPAAPLPTFAEGLMRTVKAYELLTAEAAITGDRGLLLQALLVHPLGPDADQIPAFMVDLLETHRAHLPAFHGGAPCA